MAKDGRHRPARLPRTRDDWYAALDGRRIRRGRKHWRVEVAGVHGTGNYWLQVTLVGHPSRDILLRVTPGTTSEAALHTLAELVTQERVPSVSEAA